MADRAVEITLTVPELREVARYAAGCAQSVLPLFEAAHPLDRRPREAIMAARVFAEGGIRGKALRETGWGAHRAAREAVAEVGREAARAAMAAAAAAYLHPLADAHQVKHILGAAAHAARATELMASGDQDVGE